jgi:hypothetical protein
MSTELCGCPTCLASRSASTIPAARDLASAIREQRNETPEERQLRVVKAMTPAPVAAKE